MINFCAVRKAQNWDNAPLNLCMNKRHFSQVGRTLHGELVRRVIPLMIAQTYNWTLISNCLPGTGPVALGTCVVVLCQLDIIHPDAPQLVVRWKEVRVQLINEGEVPRRISFSTLLMKIKYAPPLFGLQNKSWGFDFCMPFASLINSAHYKDNGKTLLRRDEESWNINPFKCNRSPINRGLKTTNYTCDKLPEVPSFQRFSSVICTEPWQLSGSWGREGPSLSRSALECHNQSAKSDEGAECEIYTPARICVTV